jgi:hypothetical protein
MKSRMAPYIAKATLLVGALLVASLFGPQQTLKPVLSGSPCPTRFTGAKRPFFRVTMCSRLLSTSLCMPTTLVIREAKSGLIFAYERVRARVTSALLPLLLYSLPSSNSK